jgi:DNA-binding PadR family transcriptional regulator
VWRVNVVRLLVLGTLAARGPTYGHQIKRTIETINVEAWSEIRVGSLYHALHQLEVEELIEAVRTEREGRLPARTVYALTQDGHRELARLRDQGLREVRIKVADPFDVALWVAAGLPAGELEAIARQRVETVQAQLQALAQEREQLTRKGYLPAVGQALMRHGEMRLEAELRWHAELLEKLPEIANGQGAAQI